MVWKRSILSGILSVAVFIVVMFAVAWLLEDIIYFSLFIGIPAGGVVGILSFFGLMYLLQDKKAKKK